MGLVLLPAIGVFNNGWIVSDVFWKLWVRALELYDYFRGTSANTHDMKVITNTLDNVAVKRPSDKQNLCPDKGYDFLEVQRSSIKRRYIPYIHYRY